MSRPSGMHHWGQAIMFGHEEVAEYLRTLDATLPPGFEDSIEFEEETENEEGEGEPLAYQLGEYFHSQHGAHSASVTLQELLPNKVHVSVCTAETPDYKILYTSGVSTKAFPVPEEHGDLACAEFVLALPNSWKTPTSPDQPHAWPWRWLRILGHYFHDNDTWPGGRCGGRVGTFAYGDPPERLESITDFSGFVMTYNTHFGPFATPSGKVINLIHAFPLYPEELAMVLSDDGLFELMHRFSTLGIDSPLQPLRRNCAVDL